MLLHYLDISAPPFSHEIRRDDFKTTTHERALVAVVAVGSTRYVVRAVFSKLNYHLNSMIWDLCYCGVAYNPNMVL